MSKINRRDNVNIDKLYIALALSRGLLFEINDVVIFVGKM